VTSIAERVPLDRITREACDVHFGRTVLTVVAAVLCSLGSLVARTFSDVWLVLAWTAVAVRVGWQEGRRGPARADR
jgi:hypothetical protein